MTCRLNRAWLVLAVAAALAAGCGGKKRPPAVSTAPPSEPAGRTQPTEVPPAGEPGPDVTSLGAESARGEDFTPSNPETGEGGPLEDIHFQYDSASLTDQARSTLEKHALWLQSHRAAQVM